MNYAIIAEFDESQWHDVTGVSYHFPKKYRGVLTEGTKVVYYNGTLKKARYRAKRLSADAHYFGTAVIGAVYPDKKSSKGDLFAEIREYRPFVAAVSIRRSDTYLEEIPVSRQVNYWRDGVRPIAEETYRKIVSLTEFTAAGGLSRITSVNDLDQGDSQSLTSAIEGRPNHRFVTTYERDRALREAAVRLHGTSCVACGFNFADAYGSHGAGYIHVHHLEPLAVVSVNMRTLQLSPAWQVGRNSVAA